MILGSLLLVLLIISSIYSFLKYSSLKKYTIQRKVFQLEQNLKDSMKAKKKVWKCNALLIASNPDLQNAIKNSNRQVCINLIKNYGKKFKANTTFKNVNIHIIDKNLNSFVKSWKPEKYGESLDYSDAYKEVKRTKKILTVMEVSSKGARLKGLFPIILNNEFIGIVNFEGGLNSIKRTLK